MTSPEVIARKLAEARREARLELVAELRVAEVKVGGSMPTTTGEHDNG